MMSSSGSSYSGFTNPDTNSSDEPKFTPYEQLLVIQTLIRTFEELPTFQRYFGSVTKPEAMLCIGDGYIFAFKSAHDAMRFAVMLAHEVQTEGARGHFPVRFHFRMAVHVGEVYTFFDPGREGWNYIGRGINDSTRVLGVIDKRLTDVMYVSRDVIDIMMQHSYSYSWARYIRTAAANKGRHEDKHKEEHYVYEINHTTVVEQLESDRREATLKATGGGAHPPM